MKRQNFDVSRLEDQRDAVIDKLAQTDSEVAMVKEALYGRESDFKNLKIDTELEREKVVRLTDKVNHLEDIKARIQRELYSREGELNRSQARERLTKKHLLGTVEVIFRRYASKTKLLFFLKKKWPKTTSNFKDHTKCRGRSNVI